MSEQPNIVLVHGGFGTPAEMAPVIPHLEALGHKAVAVDLPCDDPAATLSDYARVVVETIAGRDRHLDLFDESTDPARAGSVDRRASGGLSDALFR